MTEFLHMGGYGGYVWSAYGITAAVLIISLLLPLVETRYVRNLIKKAMYEEQD